MKQVYAVLILLLSGVLVVSAQGVQNPAGDYLKIKVYQDDIVSMTGAQILRYQPGWAGTNLKHLHLYRYGKDQILEVNSPGDSVLTANDTISFLAFKNRGEDEAQLYKQKRYRMNQETSLISDTTFYFMAVNTATVGRRTGKVSTPAGATSNSNLFRQTQTVAFRKTYNTGNGFYRVSKVHHSQVDEGEGWQTNSFFQPANLASVMQFPVAVNTGRNVDGEFYLAGRSPGQHPFKVSIKDQNTTIATGTLRDYNQGKFTFNWPSHRNFDVGNVFRLYFIPGVISTGNYISVGYFKFRYRSALANIKIANTAKYLSIPFDSMPNMTAKFGQHYKSKVYQYNTLDTLEVVTPNTDTVFTITRRNFWIQRKPLILPDSQLRNVTVRYVTGQPTDYVMFYPKALERSAQAYKAYRESPAGGSFQVGMYEVENLYNLYTNGEHSALAIKRFMDLLRRQGPIRHVLMFGKGVQINQGPQNGGYSPLDMVPPMGVPASDNAYSFADTSIGFVQTLSIGRIAAQNDSIALNYLNKVIAYEKPENMGLWKKNLVHLSGGKDDDEINRFKIYMKSYEDIVEGPLWAGNVHTQSKQSLDLVESVDIRHQVNAGLLLVNIFGHSASTTTDIDIGYAGDVNQGYNNGTKMPLILVNGCYAGNIFDQGYTSLNEDWVFTPNKGAIAFVGNMDEGLPPLLDRYASSFYKALFQDSAFIGLRLGEVMKEAALKYARSLLGVDSTGYVTALDTIMLNQVILHGDPAIRLLPGNKPDLRFQPENTAITVRNRPVTELRFSYVLENLGTFERPDSISYVIKHFLPDGRIGLIGPFSAKVPKSAETLAFNHTFSEVLQSGAHIFEAEVDYTNLIGEANETNNIRTDTVLIRTEGAQIIHPLNYAITNRPSIRVSVQNGGQTLAGKTIVFEADTTEAFNSRAKVQLVQAASSLNQFVFNLPVLTDSTVYFLRARLAGSTSPDSSWQNISITYIGDIPGGWSQSRTSQLRNNVIDGISLSGIKPRWSYKQDTLRIDLKSSGQLIPQTDTTEYIRINGVPIHYGSQSTCLGGDKVLAMFLKKCTFTPYLYRYGGGSAEQYWYYSCGRMPPVINHFSDAVVRSYSVAGGGCPFVWSLQSAQPGDQVIMMSQGRLEYPNWHPDVFTIMGIAGLSDSLKKQNTGSPFIHVGERTFNFSPNEGFTKTANRFDTVNDGREVLTHTIRYQSCFGQAKVESDLIGPAVAWKKGKVSVANIARADVKLELLGFTSVADTGRVISAMPINEFFSLDTIPVSRFAYLKLRVVYTDTVAQITPQLRNWMIYYQALPEGLAANPVGPAVDTLFEGQKTSRAISFVNLTDADFRDSVKVRVSFLEGSRVFDTKEVVYPNLKADSALTLRLDSMSTIGWPANVKIRFVWNSAQQPERFYTNNTAEFDYYIIKDTLNPFTKILVNDHTIEDLDYVDNPPVISVLFMDDNKYLPAISKAQARLKFGPDCGDSCFVDVDPSLYSLTADETGVEVRFEPGMLLPGDYKFQAELTDFRGNVSGKFANVVRFRILDSAKYLTFTLYPNPAANSLSADFKLTNKDLAEDLMFTVTDWRGIEVASHIFRKETLRTGNNRFANFWDLTDEGSFPLPTGSYMYRVATKSGTIISKGKLIKIR